ncbi:hypothetical protein [Mesorhizobium sp. M1136]|uniref:hypothetical protein n=1 Tax=Mesorhizobium sp. M1136 TaxID=2957059 RepID=UPI003337C04E
MANHLRIGPVETAVVAIEAGDGCVEIIADLRRARWLFGVLAKVTGIDSILQRCLRGLVLGVNSGIHRTKSMKYCTMVSAVSSHPVHQSYKRCKLLIVHRPIALAVRGEQYSSRSVVTSPDNLLQPIC